MDSGNRRPRIFRRLVRYCRRPSADARGTSVVLGTDCGPADPSSRRIEGWKTPTIDRRQARAGQAELIGPPRRERGRRGFFSVL